MTVVAVELVVFKLTVNSPSTFGSEAAAVVAAIETTKLSLSVIVPVPVSVSVTNGFTASILTVKVSVPSTIVSSMIVTSNV